MNENITKSEICPANRHIIAKSPIIVPVAPVAILIEYLRLNMLKNITVVAKSIAIPKKFPVTTLI